MTIEEIRKGATHYRKKDNSYFMKNIYGWFIYDDEFEAWRELDRKPNKIKPL